MKHLALCALGLALAAPLAAQAAPTEAVTHVKVSYADLDLSQAKGAAVMLRRLDRAAMSACGASEFSLREVRDEVRTSSCYRAGLDQAVASLSSPVVNALYREHANSLAAD